MTTFKDLGLNPDIMKSLNDLGFVSPTPIQEKAIPFILKSPKDLIALAQTGTGKTAAFALPILNQIKGKALESIIICPTRELCIQISEDIAKLAKHSRGVTVAAVYGGSSIDIQIRSLRNGVNIVVGTPGRVCDLIRRNVLKLQTIKWVVLDEADEMLDMGFKEDLDAILEQTPKTKRTLLFSATISKSVLSIAKKYMNEAEEISIGEKNIGAEMVSHEYYVVQVRDRFEALQRILDSLPGVYGILFCRTRNQTQEIADKLKQANYDSEALHGDISQNMRTKIMDRFKKKQIKLLVATDVAARGIDVNDLSHVINYNLPDQNESYTHRSGRTGRAQKKGVSISILSRGDLNRIRGLEDIIGKKFEYKKVPDGEDVCRRQIDSFIKEIEETDTKKVYNEQYFKEFAERLKKINKEDLIKHFITNKFSHLMDEHSNARDLNAESQPADRKRADGTNINLEINFGKQHGFDVRSLFALINSNKTLKGVEIGRIDLMLDHSIFAVEKSRADEVVKCLQGTKIRDRKIEIKKSTTEAGYSRKRRGRSTGSNRGRRSGAPRRTR